MKKQPKAAIINVANPNTTDLKMQAILATARALESLARAITSVNVAVTIANNSITGAETGISLAPDAGSPDAAAGR